MKIVATSDLHGYRPEMPAGGDLYIIAGDILRDRKQDVDMRNFTGWLKRIKTSNVVFVWGNHDFLGEDLEPLGWGGHYEKYKLWASPWSNNFGRWAFMKSPEELKPLYESIPEGVDIIVSHQPPYMAGDKVGPIYLQPGENEHVGSKELRDAIERVKPKLVFCGHIHEGFGEYVIGETRVLNVSHVNASYEPVNPIVEVEL